MNIKKVLFNPVTNRLYLGKIDAFHTATPLSFDDFLKCDFPFEHTEDAEIMIRFALDNIPDYRQTIPFRELFTIGDEYNFINMMKWLIDNTDLVYNKEGLRKEDYNEADYK